MNQVNRRQMVGLAAATIAVAGCKRSEGTAQAQLETTFDPKSLMAILGHNGHFGADPVGDTSQAATAAYNPPKITDFYPRYMAVVYMKFVNMTGEPKLSVRHGHFHTIARDNSPSSGTNHWDKATTERRVMEILQLFKNDRITDGDCATYDEGGTVKQSVLQDDFNRFDFGSQHAIYMFLDSTNIRFEAERPLQFTLFSANDHASMYVRAANNSFYNARARTLNGAVAGQLLYVENYHVNADGSDDFSKVQRIPYAMNINLKMPTAKWAPDNLDATIPLIIDPDTGNGLSKP